METYPSSFVLGHKAVADILSSEVVVEEKIDGSQFSFSVIGSELFCRSRGADIYLENPPDLFTKAVETIISIKNNLKEGYIYRAEAVTSLKHNILKYSRIPKGGLIGFDIQTDIQTFLDYDEKKAEFDRLGLETVPLFYKGIIKDVEFLNSFLSRESILGGAIEGIVIKNYNLFTFEKKIAIAKIVRNDFKEVHRSEWKKGNQLEFIINKYKTEARWRKAIIHMKELGLIKGKPSDIGFLLKEINLDILNECYDEIKEDLFRAFWPEISRGLVRGFPEWYKEKIEKGEI